MFPCRTTFGLATDVPNMRFLLAHCGKHSFYKDNLRNLFYLALTQKRVLVFTILVSPFKISKNNLESNFGHSIFLFNILCEK